MMSNIKQKIEEKNGRVQAAQDITPESAQEIINESKRLKAERYLIEHQRLNAEYGLEIAGKPEYTSDGRTVVALFVREIQDNQR